MKPFDCSNNTLSVQGQLVHEWVNHLDPDLDQPGQQLQALVQSTVELSLQLLRQRHWALCRRAGQPHKAMAFYCRSLHTIPQRRHYLQLPPPWPRCRRTPNGLDRLLRQWRPRTQRIGRLEQAVHLEPRLLGLGMQSPWVQLPSPLQPLLSPDTII